MSYEMNTGEKEGEGEKNQRFISFLKSKIESEVNVEMEQIKVLKCNRATEVESLCRVSFPIQKYIFFPASLLRW